MCDAHCVAAAVQEFAIPKERCEKTIENGPKGAEMFHDDMIMFT